MMKIATAALALAACLFAQQASAQATNYTFTSTGYISTTNASACSIGECETYTAGQHLSATLTFSAPLAANLPYNEIDDRSGTLIGYTFSDGIRTVTGPGPNTAVSAMFIGTNGAGLPSTFSISLQRTPGPPYLVGQNGNGNSYIRFVNISSGAASAVSTGQLCSARGPGGVVRPGPGRCNTFAGDVTQNNSAATSLAAITVTTAPAPVAPVPTLSEWAMILLGAMLAGAAALTIHRRRTA